MYVVSRYMIKGAGRAGLSPSDKSLEYENITRIKIPLFLLPEELFDFLVFVADYLIGIVAEKLVEAVDEVHETGHLFIPDGYVAAGLVSNMHIVALLHQSPNGSSH